LEKNTHGLQHRKEAIFIAQMEKNNTKISGRKIAKEKNQKDQLII